MVIRDLSTVKKHLFFCNGDACKVAGAAEMTKVMRQSIKERGLDGVVHTTKTLCNGRCYDGPVIMVMPECVYYKEVQEKDSDIFIDKIIENDTIWTEKLLYKWGDAEVLGKTEP